jgi:hypothetical protein
LNLRPLGYEVPRCGFKGAGWSLLCWSVRRVASLASRLSATVQPVSLRPVPNPVPRGGESFDSLDDPGRGYAGQAALIAAAARSFLVVFADSCMMCGARVPRFWLVKSCGYGKGWVMLTVFKRLRARLFDRGSRSTRSPRKQRQDPLLSRAAPQEDPRLRGTRGRSDPSARFSGGEGGGDGGGA